jgi:hypothetical protein
MKQTFAVIAALMLAASVGWPTVTMAQQQQRPPGATPEPKTAPSEKSPLPGMQKEQEVQGKIMSVDPSGKEVTLDNGTKLIIPDKVKVNRKALKEGAIVQAHYKEEGGQKVVTKINVRPEKSEKKS